MMKKLSKKRAIELHAEMWMWLSKHPNLEKKHFLHHERNQHKPLHSCYLCEYAKQVAIVKGEWEDESGGLLEYSACEYCPLLWPSCARKGMCSKKMDASSPSGLSTNNGPGIFLQWHRAIAPQIRSVLADIIANLPERKGRV